MFLPFDMILSFWYRYQKFTRIKSFTFFCAIVIKSNNLYFFFIINYCLFYFFVLIKQLNFLSVYFLLQLFYKSILNEQFNFKLYII